jgi:uroporphyrinogen decarboxylase
MSEMTSRERIDNILNFKPVDRIGSYEGFWKETLDTWRASGKLGENENEWEHFSHDLRLFWPSFNMKADLDIGEIILEETQETKLIRDGNGAVLRWFKDRAGVPEHVDFLVKNRTAWEEHIKPKLLDESNFERRINFEAYRTIREKCQANDLWFS